MTAVGITSYLLFLGETILALISSIVFGKLILFHFVMEYFDKKTEKNCKRMKIYYLPDNNKVSMKSCLNCNLQENTN